MFSALPRWWDAYRLGDCPDYHKALRVNESFERLLDKPVSSSRHVALSLDDISKLETCARGLVEAQSFSLWSIAAMFKFLKDSNCVPEDSGFCQLISSLTKALTTQARTSYSLQEFLQQTRRESYVSHLLGSTPQSVKHALLSTPSSKKLFIENVILTSLTKVTNDSQLSLLKNLSSLKGGGKSASSFSSSGYRCRDASSSSSRGRGSRSFRGSKRSASSSPSRRKKVSAVACLHAKGALAPSHLFTAAFLCLSRLWLPFSSYLRSSFCQCAAAFLSLFVYHLPGVFCACLGSVFDLFRYLALLFPALDRLGSSQMIPFSTSFSFVSVVLLRLLNGWCFLLWGFPRCPSSWLTCGCSSMRFLASSLPVPHVLGFPVGLWALFCLGRISGSLRDRVLPLGCVNYLLGFLRSFSFLVLHMPFLVPLRWLLSASFLLFLLSCSPLLVGLFFLGVRPPPLPWGFPSEVSVSVPSSSFCGFP